MIRNEKDGVIYYTFEHFKETGLVRHCFTTRQGGASEGCYSSMNLGLNRGDGRESVMENYRRVCAAVGFDEDKLVLSDQIHETKLRNVTEADFGKGIHRNSDITGIDGLLTDVGGAVLTTFFADCVPLFFLDPVNGVIALSHAGWRGTLMEIGAATVKEMKHTYGCRPQDILAGIGPSIGACCFEVGAEVVEAFTDGLEFAKPFISENRHIDLWVINRQTLLNAGLSAENIETAGICTKCHPEEFYSHRRDGAARGSMAALMALL